MYPQHFSTNGKLLLTGEYFVLAGAVALAVPTHPGQVMEVWSETPKENSFYWQSFDGDKLCWFEGRFSKKDFSSSENTDPAIASRLTEIFTTIHHLNPDFVTKKINKVSVVKTKLSFPREWGLGTSSTLIAMIARWSEVDPYQLLAKTFGGSGYDLACANANQSLLYQLPGPVVKLVSFSPVFSDQIYFVYLNQKQNSREGIRQYRKIQGTLSKEISEISSLTNAMLNSKTLVEFEKIINAHEELVSRTLKIERAKDLYFSDFSGEIKSLGAWGGDFVMVTSDRPVAWVENYFRKKGMNVFKTYKSLIKEDGLKLVG